jgi:hypothetical protein
VRAVDFYGQPFDIPDEEWEKFMDEQMDEQKREYSRDEPVALDDRDPSNSDPDQFTAALAPDDDVFALINSDQGDLREESPAGPETK